MEIQKMYGVSRITARQAILDLEKEGMVNRGRGRGTFVIWKPAITEELSTIRSFAEEMELHGRKPGTCHYLAGIEPMEERAASVFGLEAEKEMYCIRRVRTADDIKLVYMISYFPLESEDQEPAEAFSQFVQRGLPHRVDEEFSAQIPDDDVRTSLNIPKTLPVLARKSVGYDENGRVMEYTLSYYRSDLYSYANRRTQD
jgi:GntR family transcriptional regulator